MPTLRQIFIIPGQRRKGHATSLIRYFDSKIARKQLVNRLRFLVESPNEATVQLLKKIGFDDGRCTVIHGPF